MVDNIQFAGDVKIKHCILTNLFGKEIDLLDILIELELYEDIYAHSLSGCLTILDTFNLIDKLPIVGQEIIKLAFLTPSFDSSYEINQTFITYKISNKILENHKQLYTIHFTTPEVITDNNTTISKALAGTANDIINQILKNNLKTSKKVLTENSTNHLKFVPAFWNPFKCISYACSRAQSADAFKASNFMFFETNKQFKFQSLNTLLSQKVKAAYFYSDLIARKINDKTSNRDVALELSRIYSLTADQDFDQIFAYLNGVYSNSVWNHNLLFKTVTKHQYDYKSQFDKTKHLNKYKPTTEKFIYGNHLTKSITTYPKIHNDIKVDNYASIYTNKIPLMNQIEMVKYDIIVNGRTDLEVGDVIYVNLDSSEVILTNEKHDRKESNQTGNYLITAIHHRLNKMKHSMILSITKESQVNAI